MHRSFIRPPVALGLTLGLALVLLSATSSARQQASAPANGMTAAEFFTPARVWKAHVMMTPEAWRAMQPQSTGSGGGFGFGGGRFLGPPGGRNGVAARSVVEFDYVHASLRIDGWTFNDVAARFKGNGSYLRATRAVTTRFRSRSISTST